jgi:hypothetical protein
MYSVSIEVEDAELPKVLAAMQTAGRACTVVWIEPTAQDIVDKAVAQSVLYAEECATKDKLAADARQVQKRKLQTHWSENSVTRLAQQCALKTVLSKISSQPIHYRKMGLILEEHTSFSAAAASYLIRFGMTYGYLQKTRRGFYQKTNDGHVWATSGNIRLSA